MFQATRDHIRRFLAWLLMLDDTPHSIAMGVAAGVFISLTPTVGLHMALVVVLSLIIRLNRTAGLAAVWLNNPVTMIPVFFFNYLIGTWVLLRPPIRWHEFREAVGRALVFQHWYEKLGAVFFVLGKLTVEVAGPLWLGSVMVATALAVPAYFAVRRLATIRQKRAAETGALPPRLDAKPSPGESSDGKTL